MSHVPYVYKLYSSTRYTFVSIGKTRIEKVVEFMPTGITNVINLGFGDLLPDSSIDYITVSDNGDMIKVLATVVDIVKHFTMLHPESIVYFTGSTSERTKLYTRILKTYYPIFNKVFRIYGIIKVGNDWKSILFEPVPAADFWAFLIKRIN
jgi:hypothetical protein